MDMSKKRKTPSIVFEETQSGGSVKATEPNETTTLSKPLGLHNIPPFKGSEVDLEPDGDTTNEPDVKKIDAIERVDVPIKPFWKMGASPAPPVYESADVDHLAKVDITNRRGNYILAVGLPESGKTTLQSFMTYVLMVGDKYNAHLDVAEKNGDINSQTQLLVTNWLEKWQIGEFPDSTPVGEDEIREVRLDVENNRNIRQNFNLSFLEISGENFASIVPNRSQVPTLFKRLREFLENKKINLNIVLVLKSHSSNQNVSNDALFSNFFVFLRNQLKIKLLDRFGLIILVPNPRNIFSGDDWDEAQTDGRLFEKTMLDYIHKTCPATYKIYLSHNKKKRFILPFHIGETSEEKLIKSNFRDVNWFIRLNYKLFTGKPLKVGFWQRIMGKDLR